LLRSWFVWKVWCGGINSIEKAAGRIMVNGQGEQLPAVEGTGYGEMEEQNQRLESDQNIPDPSMKGRVGRLLWHGGSVYDAWFSAASNQVTKFTKSNSIISSFLLCINVAVILWLPERRFSCCSLTNRPGDQSA
jgi:hypothetical protein